MAFRGIKKKNSQIPNQGGNSLRGSWLKTNMFLCFQKISKTNSAIVCVRGISTFQGTAWKPAQQLLSGEQEL